MDILVIKLGAKGDVLRTTALLPALKKKHKGAKIDWVTKKDSIEFLKNNPYINKIYCIEEVDAAKLPKYELVLNPDDEEEACRLASKVESGKLIGAYTENGERKYTKDASIWFDMGLISRYGKKKADELKASNGRTYQDIHFEMFGLKSFKIPGPILNLEKKDIDFGKEFAEKNSIKHSDLVIGINTGAGGRWQEKKLSVGQTAELIDRLNNELGPKILLFGGPEEEERNGKIKEKVNTGIIDAGCKNSLMEFAALVSLCDILVTSDSLALHIGTALRKRIVCFFYPTSASEIMLYGRGIKIIGKGRDYCSYKKKCSCPPKWDIGEFVEAVKSLAEK